MTGGMYMYMGLKPYVGTLPPNRGRGHIIRGGTLLSKYSIDSVCVLSTYAHTMYVLTKGGCVHTCTMYTVHVHTD